MLRDIDQDNATGQRDDRPLSSAQRRLWFIDGIEGNTTLYNVALRFAFEGVIDMDRLTQALSAVAAHHEVFRTTIATHAGEPRLSVAGAGALPITVFENGIPEEDGERDRTFAAQAFDLQRGPLARVLIGTCDGRPTDMLLSAHHIIFDGASIAIWMEDVARAYRGERLAETPSPSMLAERDVIAMTDQQRCALRAFWRERLAGDHAPPVVGATAIPAADQCHPPTLERSIPDPLWHDIGQVARARRATPFMVMLAAWGAFLSRYSGQSEVVLGTPFTLRHSEAHGSALGYFVNTVPVPMSIDAADSFDELLSAVKNDWLTILPNAALPFEDIVAQAGRGAGEALIRQMFVYQSPVPDSDMGGDARLVFAGELHGGEARFDGTLVIDFPRGRPRVTFDYDPALFIPGTAAMVADGFLIFLQAAVTDPAKAIGLLPILSHADRDAMIALGRAEAAYGAVSPLARFAEQAAVAPGRTAIEHAGDRLDYHALHARSARLAIRLIACGIDPEEPVIVALPRGIAFVAALLGTMAAGAAAVPIDLGYPDQRLAFLLADSGARYVVTDAPSRARIERLAPAISCIEEDDRDSVAELSLPTVVSEALAYIVYTSGSTGRPKGVAVNHQALANLVAAKIDRFRIEWDSRVLQFVSVAFDVSISDVLTALAVGATLVVRPDGILGGPELARFIADERISVAVLPASVLASLPVADVPALRSVVAGGEACSRELVDRWAPGRHFVNAYGPSEMTICATTAVCSAPAEHTPPIGRPIRGDSAHVLDEEMEPVPPAVTGELYLGGIGLARGYLHPGLTADRFVPDPFAEVPGQRLYRTGDLVRRRTDGQLEFVARSDAQLKIRGMRIEPAEIVAAIERLPGAGQCVVTTVAGAHGLELAAYLTGEEGATIGSDQVRTALRQALPAAMIPSHIVILDALPLTANGKVDLAALPHPAEQITQTRIEPRTLTETILRDIWSGVLDQEPGVEDDFFRIGGHSILAAQVTAQIGARFGIEFPFRALLENPTIAALAVEVEAAILADIDQGAAA